MLDLTIIERDHSLDAHGQCYRHGYSCDARDLITEVRRLRVELAQRPRGNVPYNHKCDKDCDI